VLPEALKYSGPPSLENPYKSIREQNPENMMDNAAENPLVGPLGFCPIGFVINLYMVSERERMLHPSSLIWVLL